MACWLQHSNQVTRLVENEVGEKGLGQMMKNLESHIKEFRSSFKSHGEMMEDFKYQQDGWDGVLMVGHAFLTGTLQFVWRIVLAHLCLCVCVGAGMG